MNLKVLSIIFAIRSIAAGPVSSGELNITPGSKRAHSGPELPQYDPDRSRRKGPQGPFHYKQQIDHFFPNPEEIDPLNPKYTFNQRYWVNDKYYKHDYTNSYPVFLFISDEKQEENERLLGDPDSMLVRMAKEHSGMLVVLEHRYFGDSYPVSDLSEINLKYLTIQQALGDVENFAGSGMGHLNLRAKSTPTRRLDKFVPWVLIGAGYTGGLVHWALLPKRNVQNVFWAGYSSSGMVRAKENFWEYWDVVSRIMPPGCAKDVAEVVKYFDAVYNSHLEKKAARQRLRKELGLERIKHADGNDMAQILSYTIDYGSESSRETVDSFCDAVEQDDDGKIPQDGAGRGLGWALEGWRFYNEKTYSTDMASSHHAEYKDLKLHDISARVNKWLSCNELGWFRVAPDPEKSHTPVVSTLLNVERELYICQQAFPERYRKKDSAPYTKTINKVYGKGNRALAPNVFYTNGGLDPYLSLTLADITGDNRFETGYVDNAGHKSDFKLAPNENPDMDKVIDMAIKRIGNWLEEWRTELQLKVVSDSESDSTDSNEDYVNSPQGDY